VNVHAPTRIQAKAFFGLTKEKAMKMDPDQRKKHCADLKLVNKEMIATLKDCSPELMETLSMAVEVCGADSGTAKCTID